MKRLTDKGQKYTTICAIITYTVMMAIPGAKNKAISQM
jgi:hypothetical protein